MADRLWYFAYGSNMSRAIFVERRGIQPTAAAWGWLDGYRLCFDLPVGPGERGVANIIGDAAARTCGVLYSITAEEAERLDHSEGVPAGFYRRIDVSVVSETETVAAFTYRSEFTSLGRKPSPRYISLLLEGAKAHGLPAAYVSYLHGFDLAHDERLEREPR